MRKYPTSRERIVDVDDEGAAPTSSTRYNDGQQRLLDARAMTHGAEKVKRCFRAQLWFLSSENRAHLTSLLPCRHCRVAGFRRGSRVRHDVLTAHSDVDGGVENLVHAGHLFRGALHVLGAHLGGDGFALLLCDGCEALGFEELDAGALVSEVGLEAAKDDGCRRTEVENFRVPLERVS